MSIIRAVQIAPEIAEGIAKLYQILSKYRYIDKYIDI